MADTGILCGESRIAGWSRHPAHSAPPILWCIAEALPLPHGKTCNRASGGGWSDLSRASFLSVARIGLADCTLSLNGGAGLSISFHLLSPAGCHALGRTGRCSFLAVYPPFSSLLCLGPTSSTTRFRKRPIWGDECHISSIIFCSAHCGGRNGCIELIAEVPRSLVSDTPYDLRPLGLFIVRFRLFLRR